MLVTRRLMKIVIACSVAVFSMTVTLEWTPVSPIVRAMWAIHETTAEAANNPSNIPAVATIAALRLVPVSAAPQYPTFSPVKGMYESMTTGSNPCSIDDGR